jgi:hypothetical protein
MATYAEILLAAENEALRNKIRVACVVAAEVVRTEVPASNPNHANRMLWAKSVYADPEGTAKRMTWAVLGQNIAAPLATITGASDATVQTAVNAAVDVFATGT